MRASALEGSPDVTENGFESLTALPLPPEIISLWDYGLAPSLCGAGDGTQGFALASPALHQFSYTPSPALQLFVR